MARRHKYGDDGLKRKTFSLQADICTWLEGMPNASQYVNEQLAMAKGGDESAVIDLQLRLVDLRIMSIEKSLFEAKRDKANLEERRRGITNRKDGAMQARMELLEMVNRRSSGINLDAWLKSRTDVLAQCDFETPDEAQQWIQQARAKVVP